MNLIFLEKTLSDGRVCSYHRVTELVFLETPNTMKVLVGSWPTADFASSQMLPDAVTAIQMDYVGSMMNATDNLLERIIQTPGWEEATIINTSVINAPILLPDLIN